MIGEGAGLRVGGEEVVQGRQRKALVHWDTSEDLLVTILIPAVAGLKPVSCFFSWNRTTTTVQQLLVRSRTLTQA